MLFLLNRYHRSLILIILILISIFSWFYTITGVGMNMSAWQMTLMNLNLISHSNSMEMMEHGKNYNIFGEGGVEKLAIKYKKKFLGKIPINIDLRIAADSGKPLVEENPNHKISMIFKEMAKKIKGSFH